MAREIPEVVRAAAGLAATVVDEARKLPETLPGLPVRLVGLAMQSALKVQQHYAGFVARGDELFTGIRGENEPGLATFDDDLAPAPAGFRDSAFDRAAAEHVEEIEDARTTVEQLADEAPATDEILDELAIDEMVGDVPAPADVDVTADVSTTAEALTPVGDGEVTAADESGTPVAAATGVRTDVGETDTSAEDSAIAEGAAVDAVGTPAAAPTDEPEGGSELSGSQAAGTAPVEGYDSFTIAQLRGRLRGYALVTVQDLVAYEEATRARDPYLRMLRNRLQKLEEQAVESSPLAPRGV
jgi:hypothetical protein